jgi:hypothetical protein
MSHEVEHSLSAKKVSRGKSQPDNVQHSTLNVQPLPVPPSLLRFHSLRQIAQKQVRLQCYPLLLVISADPAVTLENLGIDSDSEPGPSVLP